MRSAPDYIQFYPTLRCNKSCDFCFNKSMPLCDDITPGDFRKIADRLSRLNVKTLDIIGGEPSMHGDITGIIEYASGKGFNLNMSSNGSDPELLSGIMKKFKNVRVGVSVNDSPTLKLLKNFISKYRPAVKMIFSNNIDTKLMSRILLSGPSGFYLLYRDVMLPGEIENSMPFPQYLFSVQRLGSPAIGTVYCSGFIPDVSGCRVLSKTRCPAGSTKLGLMPDGSVYPCNLLFGIKEFRLGSLLHESFEKIWNHRALDFFRTFKGNSCPRKTCILHNACHGGCPAHSLIHYGSVKAPEPRCVALK